MPRCAETACGRWRPERLAPGWAVGVRLNGDWYCSRACVQTAARAELESPAAASAAMAGLRRLRLGVLLRHMGAITEDQLTAALASQQRSGRRLGAELERLGYVTGEQVLRALATQANVSFLASFDISRVTRGPSWLPVEAVRALGLVPFEMDEAARRMRVLCEAPVPRAALRAMQRLTGWTPEVFLVADDTLKRALDAYMPAPAADEAGVVTVDGLDDAAAKVAESASTDRTVTMRVASWERFTWVRVEGPTHVSNLFVPGVMEGTWQAAPTAH